MMAKTKGAKSKSSLNTVSGEYSDASCSSTYGVVERTDLRLSVSRIRMSDYETYHHNKAKLKGKNYINLLAFCTIGIYLKAHMG